ncbi:DUF6249 domain-containing protein [Hyunsoonleella aestuarii]|uniref:DUF6249 domain-containing protein n=1 Tax=Hyunsoonleella aestuarii TaxID=912802 RepID=A0ABP8ECE0_9FLAO|nr:DUF6249 domain-containing protein [Hyunsoonleella aestuarii]
MEMLIPISLFAAIFGMVYLYLSTRNKERLALIEKGADASIFMKGANNKAPMWKVILVNIAVLLMGIGCGVFIATLLDEYTRLGDAVYPGTIFLTAGISLLIGFNMTKNLNKE